MRLRHLALPAAAGLTLLAIPFAPAAVAAPTCDATANTCTELFDYTGGQQTFTVPAGVSNLIVALGGAAGGAGIGADGGAGGAFEAIVPVTPGEALTLVVGGKGGDAVPLDTPAPTPPAPALGGYGGGGNGTSALDGPVGAGGGGSFLFNSSGQLLVAAGGGGGGGFTGKADAATDGGSGGGSGTGGAGVGANGGGGATSNGGGAPGAGDTVAGSGTGGTGPATSPSAFGNGGAATGSCSAGGGGGGYFGGGSGGCDTTEVAIDKTATKKVAPAADGDAITTAGGGGGGAGFVGNGASQVTEFGSVPNGNDNGIIAIGYTTAPTTTTLTTDKTTLAPGQEANLAATVTGPALTIGDPTDAASAAGKVAAAAFGAKAAALAVPTQPAPNGTTLNPGTACGTTPCTVTFFVNGTALGKPISVDPATGKATVVFTAGSEQGVRNITARYDGNLYYLQSTSNTEVVTVAGLANTGPSNVEPMIGASAALLVVGAGLVVAGRRRTQLGAHRAA